MKAEKLSAYRENPHISLMQKMLHSAVGYARRLVPALNVMKPATSSSPIYIEYAYSTVRTRRLTHFCEKAQLQSALTNKMKSLFQRKYDTINLSTLIL